ncbi:TetR/AcrR family transcriptional regulator [Pedomonas sp. V897]|uniref:TetR/AcrR family transcriptional regulator n=1 Tax=Pedomonas sp. V897 TaxID=3446482 RepID=UPI003EE1E359
MSEQAIIEPKADRRFRRRGAERHTQLLDAAESVFARKGYWGAGLREIAEVAETNLGLINYYFRTKQALLEAVVSRRRGDLHKLVDERLGQCDPASPSYGRDVIRAFIGTILELLGNRGPGWRNYLRVISQFLASYDAPELHQPLQSVDRTGQLFATALRRAFPDLSEAEFTARLYIIESSLTFLVIDRGTLDRRAPGIHSVTRLDQFLEPLVEAYYHTMSTGR